MTSHSPDRTVHLACAADDAFSMPLGVTVRSVLDHLGADRRLHLFVLTSNISDANRRRLLDSWRDERLSVEWIPVTNEHLAGIKGDGRITIASFYRILIPTLLPETVDKVLYLDADLLVRRDVGLLWDEALEGAHCLAVQDVGAPYLDAARVLGHFDRCSPFLASPTPVPNYRELGLAHDTMYFNVGVLLIDLARWRTDDTSQQLLSCLLRNKSDALWWDQYALNVVLSGRIRPLAARWNQISRIFKFPSAAESPLDEATFNAVKNDPHVVHFTSVPKPWQPRCGHPYLTEYLACLDRTAWAGTRPRAWDIARAWSSYQARQFVRRGRWLGSEAKRIAAGWAI